MVFSFEEKATFNKKSPATRGFFCWNYTHQPVNQKI